MRTSLAPASAIHPFRISSLDRAARRGADPGRARRSETPDTSAGRGQSEETHHGEDRRRARGPRAARPLGHRATKVVHLLQTKGLLIAFALFLVAFSLASESLWRASTTSRPCCARVAIVGTIAVGVTIVVIGGNLDLFGRLAALVLDFWCSSSTCTTRSARGRRSRSCSPPRSRVGCVQRASGRLRAAQLADRGRWACCRPSRA